MANRELQFPLIADLTKRDRKKIRVLWRRLHHMRGSFSSIHGVVQYELVHDLGSDETWKRSTRAEGAFRKSQRPRGVPRKLDSREKDHEARPGKIEEYFSRLKTITSPGASDSFAPGGNGLHHFFRKFPSLNPNVFHEISHGYPWCRGNFSALLTPTTVALLRECENGAAVERLLRAVDLSFRSPRPHWPPSVEFKTPGRPHRQNSMTNWSESHFSALERRSSLRNSTCDTGMSTFRDSLRLIAREPSPPDA